MSIVYATEEDPVQYLCRECGRDLTNPAKVLGASFEEIKAIHENAHRAEAFRVMTGICQNLVWLNPFPWEEEVRENLKNALRILSNTARH